MRISGFDIPDKKRIEASLPYVYGVGRVNVKKILSKANIDPNVRTKDLNKGDAARLQKALETVPVGGDLRRIVLENIKRLKDIGCYRGMRHARNLPTRGQRTKSNARVGRGKKRTIGAIRKDVARKMAKGGRVKKGEETGKKSKS